MSLAGYVWPLALLLLIVLAFLLRGTRRVRYPKGDLPYFSRRHLLSRGEFAFFRVLEEALPPDLIACPKVRLSDVINCSDAAWREGFGGRISQKHVDFVLMDRGSAAIVCAVELDDRSHQRRATRDRDDFVDRALAAAGVPVVRFKAQARYDISKVREELHAAVA